MAFATRARNSTRLKLLTQLLSQPAEHHEADIMAVGGVLLAGIAQADDEIRSVGCRQQEDGGSDVSFIRQHGMSHLRLRSHWRMPR